MIQSDRQFISSFNDWELDGWLKKYNLSQTALNKRQLLQLIQDTKIHYHYGLQDRLSLEKLDDFYKRHNEEYKFE